MISFGENLKICVIGSSGGLGSAFVQNLEKREGVESIIALSRKKLDFCSSKIEEICIDIESEESIIRASKQIEQKSIDVIIVATGILQNSFLRAEKRISQIEPDAINQVFRVNAVGPILVMKHFLPLMNADGRSIFAFLSAKVGSITDNKLGGWASYRSSKAALNMLIKTASIEIKRSLPSCIIVSLHPGTVDTNLSKPYQSGVPKGKLFSPDYAVENLLNVIDNLTIADTGCFFSWNGEKLDY
jgi:NAD(P)-dependent dehydrogenase (short-subunit alcohol dehydrogenase family)